VRLAPLNTPARIVLAACAASMALWPISYVFPDRLHIQSASRRLTLEIGPGFFAFTLGPSRRGAPAIVNEAPWSNAPDGPIQGFPRIYSSPGDYHFYTPLWLLAASAALFAAGFLISLRLHRPFPPGHCPKCGYDLRATPSRCPECGADMLAS
jgi:hypothetical protein